MIVAGALVAVVTVSVDRGRYMSPIDPGSTLVWAGDELPCGGDAKTQVNYVVQRVGIVDRAGLESIAWLHSIGRRKWNQVTQKYWSKAWVTDRRHGGKYVSVLALTTWMSGFWDGRFQSQETTLSNVSYVEQGPAIVFSSQLRSTPLQLYHRSWCRGPFALGLTQLVTTETGRFDVSR